jgi:hypothetical protein
VGGNWLIRIGNRVWDWVTGQVSIFLGVLDTHVFKHDANQVKILNGWAAKVLYGVTVLDWRVRI